MSVNTGYHGCVVCVPAARGTCHVTLLAFSSILLYIAAMSWMANYLILPLFMNRFTACGKGTLETAIRNLIPEEGSGPEEGRAQMKVMHCSLHTYIHTYHMVYLIHTYIVTG